MAKYAAALDQGTTSTRAMVFDHAGRVVSVAQHEHRQIYPKPGWVEHDPIEIWERSQQVMDEVLDNAGIDTGELCGLGITNQRETTVVWDRQTGKTDPQRDRLAGHAHRPARAELGATPRAARTASARPPACRSPPTSPARRSAGSSTTSTAPASAPRPASWPSATSTAG